jgi:hypothetical protein
MHPLGFDGVEPRAFDGQRANQQAASVLGVIALCPTSAFLLFETLVVRSAPRFDSVAQVPRGVVPRDNQNPNTAVGQSGRDPLQKGNRHATHGAPRDKTQPHLVSVITPKAITGHRLRFTVFGFGVFGFFMQAQGRSRCPSRKSGLSQARKPDFVFEAKSPIGALPG